MSVLAPWAYGPFELILHAELHLLEGNDFDRRIALIGYDNAVEVAITTYLTLNPIHRQGRQYPRQQVDQWLTNFHTKLDFFEADTTSRAIPVKVEKSHLIWYHQIRNDQYHGGTPSIPDQRALMGVREGALWIFSVLFDVVDVESLLQDRLVELQQARALPPKEDQIDRVIDEAYGVVTVAGTRYYTSEILYSVDPVAYRTLGLELDESVEEGERDAG